MNKILLGFGVSVCVMLSATQAVNYTFKAATPKAVLHAVELGMNKSTAQAMYDDGVDAKDIKPRFVSAWKKDKQGQVGGAKQFKALQARMNNPLLKQAFTVLNSDKVKQKLIEKERMVQLKSGNTNKRGSLSLADIKQMMSNDEFMAYTDVLWHRRTSQPLLELPSKNNSKSINNQKAATLTVGDSCLFNTIAGAISTASDGDTILVEAKTFTGIDARFDTLGKSLIIEGGYDSVCQGLDINGNRTVLLSNLAADIINIDLTGGKSVELFGFDISGTQNDGSDFTSGVHVISDGGFGNLTIGNTHIHDNNSKKGGGLAIENGALVTLEQGTEIYANNVIDSGRGAGIYCSDSFVTADNVLIGRFNGVGQGNIGSLNALGGGLYAKNCEINFGTNSGPVEINFNDAQVGSAIYLINSTMNMAHVDSRVSFNSGLTKVVLASTSNLTLEDVQVTDNTTNTISVFSVENGSELHISSACVNSPCAEISRNKGSVFLPVDNAIITADKVLITDNSGSHIVNSTDIKNDISITNSLISGNSARLLFNLEGASTSLTLDSTTIANNITLVASPNEMFHSINGSEVFLQSSIIWGNNHDDLQTGGSANIMVEDSVIQYDPAGFTNTVMQDPLFIDEANGDFHIMRNSPAIDRSSSILTDDIDGDSRPIGFGKEAGMDEYSDLVGINGAVCNYTTVSQAIAAASNTDTIYISKGTYTEQLGLVDKDLDFVSAIDDCSTVDLTATKTDVTIDGNNQFSLHGGILEVAENRSISFSNMSLKNAQAEHGGIIWTNFPSLLVLTDVNISNGSASIAAGNILAGGSIIFNGDTTVFSGFATFSNGGMRALDRFIMNDTSHIGLEDFGNQSPTATGLGCLACDLTMNDDSAIYANIASNGSGGVFAASSNNIAVSVTMNDNAMIGSGFDSLGNVGGLAAGIFFRGDEIGQFTMNNNSSVQHNLAIINIINQGGGGMILVGANVNFNSGNVSHNRLDPLVGGTSFGAGIYIRGVGIQDTSQVTIGSGFSVDNNTRTDLDGEVHGGGIAITGLGNSLTINGATISNNTSNVGGGIAVFEAATLEINQATIENNTATGPGISNGGGVFIDATSSVIVNESTFLQNTAQVGAGIYTDGGDVTITGGTLDTIFNNNNANISGGGIYAKNADLDLTGPITFTLNSSNQGGAVFLDIDAEFVNVKTPQGSLLVNNNNAVNGGGVYAIGSNVILIDGEFSNNTATGKGGALFLNSGSTSDLKNMQLIKNSADMGGAIYQNGSSTLNIFSILNCLQNQIAPKYCSNLTDNSSISGGATIVVDSQNENNQFRIERTVVHDNTPNTQGGILIMGNNTDALIFNNLFFNNGPKGIVSNDASKVLIRNNTMENSGISINVFNPNSQIDKTIVWNTDVNVPVGTTGGCNISPNNELNGSNADPLFETALEGPYHLSINSPAVDQCTNIFNGADLDGRIRTINSNGVDNVGFETDIGAFERPIFGNLIVSKSGFGSVASDLAGINCGLNCSQAYEIGKEVQLTATPANGFIFKEWTGACFNQSSVCTVIINGLTETNVVFSEIFALTVSTGGIGSGHVESVIPGINCGSACTGDYQDGTSVTLNAITDNMVTTFDHWEGTCNGQGESCTLTMDADKTTQAFFTAPDEMFSDGFED